MKYLFVSLTLINIVTRMDTVVGHKSGHFFGVFLSLKILKGRKIDFVSANKG